MIISITITTIIMMMIIIIMTTIKKNLSGRFISIITATMCQFHCYKFSYPFLFHCYIPVEWEDFSLHFQKEKNRVSIIIIGIDSLVYIWWQRLYILPMDNNLRKYWVDINCLVGSFENTLSLQMIVMMIVMMRMIVIMLLLMMMLTWMMINIKSY